MQNEVTWRHEHLMWTRSGTVWAIWRLQPRPYGFADPAERDKVRREHQALFQALRGEGLFLGLSSRIDSRGVVDRMMRGVQMDQCPAHLEEASLTLGAMDGMVMGSRAYYLAVPLTRLSFMSRIGTQIKAGYGLVRDTVGARRLSPSKQEVLAAMLAANHIEQALPPVFEARPATLAEQSWIYAHQMMRGLDIDLPEPEVSSVGTSMPKFVSGAEFGDPWLDEGGMTELTKGAQRVNPFRRRFLKVQSPHVDEASYQVMLAMTGTPPGGWMFPGVEWLSWCDQFPVEVDWAVRLHVYDSETARTKNKHAEQGLDDQIKQLGGDSTITGGEMELQRNAQLLQEYHAQLTSDEREVEIQPTTIFTVAAGTSEQAISNAALVTRAFRAQSFILEPVLGEQEALWWATLPGTSSVSVVRQVAQLTTGRDFSTTVPFISNELGDADGILLGLNRSTSKPAPLFANLHGATQSNQSGCVAIVGDLGKGKSVTIKKLSGSAFDRGGVLVIIDRSEPMEYANFAQSLAPDSTAVVEILKPAWSLDPLRVFGTGEEGAQLALSLLNSLLDLDPLSPEGAYLSSLFAVDDEAQIDVLSLRALRNKIAKDTHPSAQSLAQRVDVYARHKLGRVLFDDSIPPIPLDYRALVFCTRGLELPSDTEMSSEIQLTRLPIEKRFGLRMYKYLAAIGRQICFADDSTFALFVTDEVRALAQSHEGREDIARFVLEGRKSAAAIVLGGQTVSQLGDRNLWGLIPTRIVCGHEDYELAKEAAAWVGWDPDVDANVKAIQELSPRDPRDPKQEVPENRRGEIILRDAYGRVGPGRILLPFTASRRQAILTTPPRQSEVQVA